MALHKNWLKRLYEYFYKLTTNKDAIQSNIDWISERSDRDPGW